ncbi:protein lurp-one-related 6 [Phtheirospermum japonicum]|uniref:Protein lurp-one-related 6 n=1 Tax=Phtheirospermum japonicum TaxID=374723 RepID=A0A830CZ76_9LAMI|nr:protein lurp-one-related 6 [Phtheirospermum japonicum]
MTAKPRSIMPIVSKVYCSPSEVVLVVRRRPNVANGGGFVVADCSQRVVFWVDGCGILGRKEELILRDGQGNTLLLIRRKIGVKKEVQQVMASRELYHVEIKAGIDQAFVFGVIAVLDYIYDGSTRC